MKSISVYLWILCDWISDSEYCYYLVSIKWNCHLKQEWVLWPLKDVVILITKYMSYQVPDWTFYIIPKENKIEIKKFFMTSIMNSPTVKDWCSKPKMKNIPQCQTSLTIAFVFLIFGVDTGKIRFLSVLLDL